MKKQNKKKLSQLWYILQQLAETKNANYLYTFL